MIEQTILNNLIQNEEYVRKVIPYLKAEYFHDYSDRFIFKGIVETLKNIINHQQLKQYVLQAKMQKILARRNMRVLAVSCLVIPTMLILTLNGC